MGLLSQPIIRIIVRNQQKTDGQGSGQPQVGEEDDDADDEPGPGQEEAAATTGGGHLHCQRQRGPQQRPQQQQQHQQQAGRVVGRATFNLIVTALKLKLFLF